jgi:surface antigen
MKQWTTSTRAWLLLAAAASLSTPVLAQNYGFMRDTPVSRFNKEDMRLHNQAAQTALDAPDLGKPVAWSNPKSGNSGSATAAASKREGCRMLTVETKASIGSAKNEFHLCKIDGKWKAEKT